MTELFPTAFVESIQMLRLGIGPMRAQTAHGEHRGVRTGSSLDFRDFEAYSQGADLRRVDWNIYRRTGGVFLRCYDFLQTLPVYILLDLSESMFFESPPRVHQAMRIAAAIASAALRQQDSISIFTFGDRPGPALQKMRGHRQLPHVLSFLSALQPMKKTDLAGAVQYLQHQAQRPGVAVILSDFFDEKSRQSVVDGIGTLRHRRVVIRLARESDREMALDGDLELLDCETGARRKISASARIAEQYRQSYIEFADGLQSAFRSQRTNYHVVGTDTPVLDEIGNLFPQGSMVV